MFSTERHLFLFFFLSLQYILKNSHFLFKCCFFFFEELLNNPRKETKNVPQMQSTKNPAAVAFVGIYLSASQFDARSDSV